MSDLSPARAARATAVALPLATPPDLLALHAADPERFFCLLDSAAQSPRTGRYHLLFAAPRHLGSANGRDLKAASQLLRSLDVASDDAASEAWPDLPFTGGFVFHLGYEAAKVFEPGLELPAAPGGLPTLSVWAVDEAVIVDTLTEQAWCVAPDRASAEALRKDAAREYPVVVPDTGDGLKVVADAGERFTSGVRRIKEYLLAGDAFQVNLSRGWCAMPRHEVREAGLHAAMRRHNAAPFSALLRHGDSAIVSASPERLVRTNGRSVETRPIAGTRRRGRSAAADARLCAELGANLKERAEHIMLIDLERNDLGRICEPGSVQVEEMLSIEHYASVHHLVSNVTGRLQAGLPTSQVLRAVFPGGTITGCPKFRVMQIIAELEGVGRGSYTGSLGYVSRNGRMDSNILIRTLELYDGGIHFRAGAGIVADSDPMAELRETEAKARGLLMALQS